MALSVLLIGASGNLGRYLTAELTAQKSKFAKIGILTDPSRAEKFKSKEYAGFEIVQGWFLDPSVYKGYDVVLCLVGIPLIQLQPGMIEGTVRP
jgi:uncharacterized protein YbjT (DUF2867 family)